MIPFTKFLCVIHYFLTSADLFFILVRRRQRHSCLLDTLQNVESVGIGAHGEIAVMDLIFIASTALFVVIAVLYVRACERLKKG